MHLIYSGSSLASIIIYVKLSILKKKINKQYNTLFEIREMRLKCHTCILHFKSNAL